MATAFVDRAGLFLTQEVHVLTLNKAVPVLVVVLTQPHSSLGRASPLNYERRLAAA